MKKQIIVKPDISKDYTGCENCVYTNDTTEICILRQCVHAIGYLRECFIPIHKEKGEQNK